MKVNFGFLCDYADATGGKLNAMGIGFDTIYANTVPATHRQMFAVVSIEFSSVEVGPKDIALHIINADGGQVIPPIARTLNVPNPTPGYSFRTQRIVIGIGDLTFPTYGDYSVVWLVGSTEVHRMTVRVAEPPPSPSTA